MSINVMFVLNTWRKCTLFSSSHACSSFLSGADPTNDPFPAMEPTLEVVPIPAMVPAPIMVLAPAWNRLKLWLFETNSDSDSGIRNYRNRNSSSSDLKKLSQHGSKHDDFRQMNVGTTLPHPCRGCRRWRRPKWMSSWLLCMRSRLVGSGQGGDLDAVSGCASKFRENRAVSKLKIGSCELWLL